MGGEHGRLPYLALLAFAVAQQGEHAGVVAVEAQAAGHAGGDGEALAEGAGGHLDARAQLGVGVALQPAAQLAQGHELLAREEPGVSQHGVEGRGRVALGQHEPVAAGHVRVGRVVRHHAAEVQRREHVDAGERAAWMAAARLGYHLHDVGAHRLGALLEFWDVHIRPFSLVEAKASIV